MAYIQTIADGQAEGLLRDLYETERRSRGYVPNFAQAFSLRPEVYDAWLKLVGTFRPHLRLRRYELVTFAAAMAMDCTY